MFIMLNPSFQNNELPISSHVEHIPAEKPGVEGIKPLMLLASMVIGASMWMGLFYAGHTVLQAIF